MRTWTTLHFYPTEDQHPLLPSVFEALFGWDPSLCEALPDSVKLVPGFSSMAHRCTGDAELSMRVALQIVSSSARESSSAKALLYGVAATGLDPKWTTVGESWDTMYMNARNDDNLEKILIWMSFFVHTLEQGVGRLPSEPSDRRITFVDDLGDVLPEELTLLNSENETLRAEFMSKLLDGSLMGMTRPVLSTRPEGPVFILLDQSKSMSFLDQRVKGLALAMYRLFVAMDRPCYVMPFSTRVSGKRHWYTGGDPSVFCQAFMGGGTSGFQALNDVLDVTQTLALSGSTIIMVSDGAFSTTPRTRRSIQQRLEESSAKVGFFLVGLSHEASLMKLGKVVTLGNLTNLTPPNIDEIVSLFMV